MTDNENKNNCPYGWYKIGGMCIPPSLLYKDKLKITMSKAKQFIREHTRSCSNIIKVNTIYGAIEDKEPWLTPDDARRAVEIAREEIIKRACNWIEENIGEYCDGENTMFFSATHIENIDIFEQERFINDLKQAIKDE